jgi:hypothetical protein
MLARWEPPGAPRAWQHALPTLPRPREPDRLGGRSSWAHDTTSAALQRPEPAGRAMNPSNRSAMSALRVEGVDDPQVGRARWASSRWTSRIGIAPMTCRPPRAPRRDRAHRPTAAAVDDADPACGRAAADGPGERGNPVRAREPQNTGAWGARTRGPRGGVMRQAARARCRRVLSAGPQAQRPSTRRPEAGSGVVAEPRSRAGRPRSPATGAARRRRQAPRGQS